MTTQSLSGHCADEAGIRCLCTYCISTCARRINQQAYRYLLSKHKYFAPLVVNQQAGYQFLTVGTVVRFRQGSALTDIDRYHTACDSVPSTVSSFAKSFY